MARLYVYALVTALLFGSFVAEGTRKTFSNDEVMEMMRTLQNEMATLKSENRKAQAQIADLQTETKELREDKTSMMEEIKWLMAEQGQTTNWVVERQAHADTLFFATISEYSIPVDGGDPIIWNTAQINPGGHFDTILGMYTAPVHGYYQFSVNKHGDNYSGSFYLLVDEVRYAWKNAHFFNSDSAPSGSATINIELTAGQIIRVENEGSALVYGTDGDGYIRSWFSGFLLYAL